MIPHAADNDDPWACRAHVDGVRCVDPATSGGFCPAHHRHDARRWRLIATDADGTVIHDSRVHGDDGLNDAIHVLEARSDWTLKHRVKVAPA